MIEAALAASPPSSEAAALAIAEVARVPFALRTVVWIEAWSRAAPHDCRSRSQAAGVVTVLELAAALADTSPALGRACRLKFDLVPPGQLVSPRVAESNLGLLFRGSGLMGT